MNGNEIIEIAIEEAYKHNNDRESTIMIFKAIIANILQEEEIIVSYVSETNLLSEDAISKMKPEEEFSLNNDVKLKMELFTDTRGRTRVGVFTNEEEAYKSVSSNVIVRQPILNMLGLALELEDVDGIVINPFGKFIALNKEVVKAILDDYYNALGQ